MTFYALVAICYVFLLYKKDTRPYLCIAVTTQNAAENICIISHGQNVTEFRPSLLLTVIDRLLITNKGRSGFDSTKNTAKVKYDLSCQYQQVHPSAVPFYICDGKNVLPRLNAGVFIFVISASKD
jgi:hypothetical protein